MNDDQKTDIFKANQESEHTNNSQNFEKMLEFVFVHGLPMHREGQYRYHGVSEPVWWSTQVDAVCAAINDFETQSKS